MDSHQQAEKKKKDIIDRQNGVAVALFVSVPSIGS